MTRILNLAFIIQLLFFSPCKNSINIAKEVGSPLLSIKLDSIIQVENPILLFKLKNTTNDTIIFPRKYIHVNFNFKDSSIHRVNRLTVKMSYPVSDFQKLSSINKNLVLKFFCKPYVNDEDFVIVYPQDIMLLKYDLKELGFKGFNRKKSYIGEIKIHSSNEIKKFCPRIWSGEITGEFTVEL